MLASSSPAHSSQRRKRWAFAVGALLGSLGALSLMRWLTATPGQQIPTRVTAPATKPAKVTQTTVASAAAITPRQPTLLGTHNILLAGLDRRPGSTQGGGLTDTLLVIVLRERTGEVGLLSVPRDLWVDIPGFGRDRINTAYGNAWRTGQRPLALLERVMSETLGIPIHQGLVLDLSVFEQLVDAVDGVDVEVACPLVDDFVDGRQTSGRRVIEVAAGRQHMDGATAAMYVRSRHGRSDFSRARRQQAVLVAIQRHLSERGGIGRVPELWATVEGSIVTDLKRYQLLDLAHRAVRLNPSRLPGLVFSDAMAHAERINGRAVLVPNFAAIDLGLGGLFRAPAAGREASGGACPPSEVALRRRRPSALGAGGAGGNDEREVAIPAAAAGQPGQPSPS